MMFRAPAWLVFCAWQGLGFLKLGSLFRWFERGSRDFEADGDLPDFPEFRQRWSFRQAADLYVRNNSYADTNFGAAGAMEVKNDSSGSNTRQGFMRLSLSGLGSTVTPAIQATPPRQKHIAVPTGRLPTVPSIRAMSGSRA